MRCMLSTVNSSRNIKKFKKEPFTFKRNTRKKSQKISRLKRNWKVG